MSPRYLRRWWDQSRGDEFDDWGTATYFFEVGDDGWPLRQVELYDYGPILRYGPDHLEDRFGFLGQASLDAAEEWSTYQIEPDEFAEAWQQTPILIRAGATLPTIDVALATGWQRTVYQMARETGARVNGPVHGPGPGGNCYRLDLSPAVGPDRALMLNAAIRLVAGCRIDLNGTLDLVFDAVPRENLFLAAGFRVTTASELALPLRSGHLARLSPAERRDVAYHNAQQIGDALFNRFD